MRTLILIIALFISAYSINAQTTIPANKTRKMLLKTSPTKPLMESVNIGLEYQLGAKHSIEIEGSVSNLKAKSTDFIYGYTSYDYNKYTSASIRVKRYHKNESMKNRSGFFNGVYLAPGMTTGNKKFIFYKPAFKYVEPTLDAGIILTFKEIFVFESFIGSGISFYKEDNSTQSTPTLRLGFRIGTTI